MYKIIMYSLFFIIMSYGAAFSENFQATGFWYDPQLENPEIALLVDRRTGEEWIVQKGDVVEGWTIAAITPEYVKISRYMEDQDYIAVHTLYFDEEGPILLKPHSNQ